MRLHPPVKVTRQQQRRGTSRRYEPFYQARLRFLVREIKLPGWQPCPRPAQCLTVHRIVWCAVLHLLWSGKDDRSRRFAARTQFAVPVDPPEPLLQRVVTGAFGNERVKVKVGTRFDRLRRGNHQWPVIRPAYPTCLDAWRDSREHVILIERTHASRDQVAVEFRIASQRCISGTRGSHPVHNETNHSMLTGEKDRPGGFSSSLRDCLPLARAILSAASDLTLYRELACRQSPGQHRRYRLIAVTIGQPLNRPVPFG